MGDINYWNKEFLHNLEDIENLFVSLREDDEEDPDSLDNREEFLKRICKELGMVEAKLNRLKDVKKGFVLEMRLLPASKTTKKKSDDDDDDDVEKGSAPAPGTRAAFEAKLREYDSKIMAYSNDHRKRKAINDKQRMRKGGSNDIEAARDPNKGMGVGGTDGLMADVAHNMRTGVASGYTNDDVLGATNIIQDRTFESLARTRGMIEQSREVGEATLEQLRKGQEQMKDISEDVDELGAKIDRASELVMNYTSRLAGDRCIQGFFAVNLILIIVIAIVATMRNK